ncbi:tRNA epoxyqueuosine(34) reductase QueG [Cupriavidus basilensis]
MDLSRAEAGLMAWLAQGYHGDMDYMANHGLRRARPAELVPGTVRAIVARMPYLPAAGLDDWRAHELARLDDPATAVISLYARGRDYHKVLRNRLQQLASRIEAAIGPFGYRVFTDSAPVMEVALAAQGGLGWRGKHTLLLDREGGSMFFLGEILVDVPFPADAPEPGHCGNCRRCIDICPTQAILEPYRIDARRCISYLTIEHKGAIPEALRAPMGNRVYGCDDCQLACPVEQVRPPRHAARLRRAQWLRRARHGRAVRLDRGGIQPAAGRQPDPPHRPRTLAAQPGGGAGQQPARGKCQRRRGACRPHTRRAGGAPAQASPLVREHIDWALAQDRAAEPRAS